MKNLIFQYYIPYENFDADMGGAEMPDWAHTQECGVHKNMHRYVERSMS